MTKHPAPLSIVVLTAAALFLLCPVRLHAIPALPVRQHLMLDDGTQVTARLVGDEHYHYWLTDDGRVLTSAADGVYSVSPLTTHEAQQQHRQAMRRANRARRVSGERNLAPRGLVILVNFSDLSFRTPDARQEFDNMLNLEGYVNNGATGSVRDYFAAQSYGQYVPQFDVVGPYTLTNSMSYYGGNTNGRDANASEMIGEACSIAYQEGVDFSLYDSDYDGYVDFIYVFYAGYGEASGGGENTIWPHASWLNGYMFNGKRIGSYACGCELRGNTGGQMDGIGTMCHEFSHVLGLPDLYCTDYSSDHKTPGWWDVMNTGCYLNQGRTPPCYSAYERFYLGWQTPVVLNQHGSYSLRASAVLRPRLCR